MSASRVETDPRIRRRRRAVHRSQRRRLLVGATALLALVATIWTVLWSPLLSVQRVSVVGAENASVEDVTAATDLLESGQNLLLLSTEKVARRVEALPWVKAAEVDRMLPGTVRVTVIERKPAMVLSLGAARWTLDKLGNVLEAGTAKGLPVLAGVEVGRVQPGVKLLTEESTDALRVFRAMPRRLRSKVAAIFAPTTERITLSLQEGTVVRFGAAERLPDKLKVLEALLSRLEGEGRSAEYIDVRVPTSPAIGSKADADKAIDTVTAAP
jgi:cell division protein FtsQ